MPQTSPNGVWANNGFRIWIPAHSVSPEILIQTPKFLQANLIPRIKAPEDVHPQSHRGFARTPGVSAERHPAHYGAVANAAADHAAALAAPRGTVQDPKRASGRTVVAVRGPKIAAHNDSLRIGIANSDMYIIC